MPDPTPAEHKQARAITDGYLAEVAGCADEQVVADPKYLNTAIAAAFAEQRERWNSLFDHALSCEKCRWRKPCKALANDLAAIRRGDV